MTTKNFLLNIFEPGPNHVIIGRGKQSYNHQGNQKLRNIVASKLEEYSATTAKKEKSHIICSIIDQIRTSQPEGGFVKKDKDGGYCDVGNFLSSDKISQTFRDLLRGSYKSSNAYKKNRRKNLKRQVLNSIHSPYTQVQSIDRFPLEQRLVPMPSNRNIDLLCLLNNGGGQKLFKRPRFEPRRSNIRAELNQTIQSTQSSQIERVDTNFYLQEQSSTLFSLPPNSTLSSQPALNKQKIDVFKSNSFRRTSLGANPLHGLSFIATANEIMIPDATKSTVVSSDESASDSSTFGSKSKCDTDSDSDDSCCQEFSSDFNSKSSKEDRWRMNLGQLENFYKKNGFNNVLSQSNCAMHTKLARWIEEQRKDYLNFYEGRRTLLTAIQIVQIEKFGFSRYLRRV